ncbi:MAG: hypothetical protein Q9217_003856 [Psora testacea]
MELHPVEPQPALLQPAKDQLSLQENHHEGHQLSDAQGQAQDPENAVEALARWNNPKINLWRLATLFFTFINFGMNDACFGALLPYIQEDYHLSYIVASLVFLSPFVGYTLAALVSDRLHMRYGRRGIALTAPMSRLLAYIVVTVHPPYPAVVVILTFAGFGNGLLDGAWNAWVGTMSHANQILGLLHGCYGAGATISPSIATAMVVKYGLDWWQFFYLMTGLVVAELIVVTAAFWDENGASYRHKSRNDSEDKGMTRRAVRKRTTWVAAAFLLTYMGVEVSTGGYIVVFMTRVRHGQPFSSGMTATGFWLGVTVGRIILGFVTPKIGERLSVIVYTVCAIAVELLFWLVPQFIVSAVAIALVGFFIGPFFPSAVIMATKLLPRELHVASIGFSSALGGGGAAVLPFLVGAIVQAKGVTTLQPIILAFLCVLLGIWLLFPRIPEHQHQG